MIQAYKSQDFIYAAYFAKKLIQLAQVQQKIFSFINPYSR